MTRFTGKDDPFDHDELSKIIRRMARGDVEAHRELKDIIDKLTRRRRDDGEGGHPIEPDPAPVSPNRGPTPLAGAAEAPLD